MGYSPLVEPSPDAFPLKYRSPYTWSSIDDPVTQSTNKSPVLQFYQGYITAEQAVKAIWDMTGYREPIEPYQPQAEYDTVALLPYPD